jgi:MFS family permease
MTDASHRPRTARGAVGPPTATAVTLLAASTLTVMAPTIVAPALPSIAREFAGVAQADLLVPLVLTLPALVIAVTASGAGALVDRIGRRPVLLGGILLYGLAGGTGVFVGSLRGLLAGRIGLGLAVAAVLTAVTTLIGDLYGGQARSQMLARQAAVMGVSGTVFTIVSGVLAGSGWRWSFVLYPLAFGLLPAVARTIPAPRQLDPTGGRYDAVPGPGTVSDTRRMGPPHPAEAVIAMGRAAIGVLVVSIGLLALVQIVFYLLPVQLPFVLEEVFGLGPATMGLFVAIPPLAYAGASLTSARISAGRRRASVVALAFGVTGVGYLAVGLAPNLAVVALGLAIGGAGLGLIVPSLVGWIAYAAPARLRGRLMGLMTSVLFLGQFVSPVVWSPVVRAAGRQAALAVAAGALLLLALLAVLLDLQRRRRPSPDAGGGRP